MPACVVNQRTRRWTIKSILIGILFCLVVVCRADMLSVILALEQVESSGNVLAYHPAKDAVGVLQITPDVVRDVNRIAGQRFSLNDRWDRRKSRMMAVVYLTHYCSVGRLGRKPAAQDYAMVWSKGPQAVWLPRWENQKYINKFWREYDENISRRARW